MAQLVYEIDDRDRIVAVGDDWRTFAEANGAAGLHDSAVVGRRLYDFIAGDTVREVYAAIIARARSGRPIRFQYRCDAPTSRREFEMRVVATAADRVTFVSTLVREVPREPVALFELTAKPERPYVRMCSWCHAVADQSGQWQPLETAITSAPLMDEARHGGVTHGICPACVQGMFGILQQHAAPRAARADGGVGLSDGGPG